MTTPLALDPEGPVSVGFRTVTTFVPKLIGFLLILIIGYFIAKFVSKLVDKLLERAGFDQAVEKGGIKKALSKSQYDASDIVAKLVFFAIFIPVLSAAVGALGIQALQQPLAAFITLIPKIIVAIILVVIGAVLAGAAKSFIENALSGLSYGKIVANATAILIMLGFVKSALDQVGIATSVTGPLLYAILGTVAGILIVGAGGGLIKPMQGRWESMLNNAAQEKDKLQQQQQQQQQQQAGRSQRDAATPTGAVYPVEPTRGSAPVTSADAPTTTFGTPR